MGDQILVDSDQVESKCKNIGASSTSSYSRSTLATAPRMCLRAQCLSTRIELVRHRGPHVRRHTAAASGVR